MSANPNAPPRTMANLPRAMSRRTSMVQIGGRKMSVVLNHADLARPESTVNLVPLSAPPVVEIETTDTDSKFVIRPSSAFSRYWDLLVLCFLFL